MSGMSIGELIKDRALTSEGGAQEAMRSILPLLSSIYALLNVPPEKWDEGMHRMYARHRNKLFEIIFKVNSGN